jgi:hypothetical protein
MISTTHVKDTDRESGRDGSVTSSGYPDTKFVPIAVEVRGLFTGNPAVLQWGFSRPALN